MSVTVYSEYYNQYAVCVAVQGTQRHINTHTCVCNCRQRVLYYTLTHIPVSVTVDSEYYDQYAVFVAVQGTQRHINTQTSVCNCIQRVL